MMAKLVDASDVGDVYSRYAKRQAIEAELKTVKVLAGALEIIPQDGCGKMSWMVQVLLDGKKVERVRSLDLHIEVGKLPTVTIVHFV